MTATINNDVYDELADAWWDEHGFLNLLKAMVNPWRVPYFKRALQLEFGSDPGTLRLLDIGSGGGVLTEEFAALGCRVTGIDPSARSIEVAQAHALAHGLSIDYRVGSGTRLPFDDQSFDVVSCCDVLEHIADWRMVISEIERVLVPGGVFLFDTINRTLPSRVAFIFGLQDLPLTRLMPRNTHVWEMFITPAELTSAIEAKNMKVKDIQGGAISANPFSTLWAIGQKKLGRISFGELGQKLKMKLSPNRSLNYLGYAKKTR